MQYFRRETIRSILKMLKVMRNLYFSRNVMTNKNGKEILNNVDIISVQKYVSRCFGSNVYPNKGTSEQSNLTMKTDGSENKTRRNVTSPRITVISNDLKLTVMTLDEATKLSKRRDLKLVKIIDLDRKTQRPVYKLMTGAEYYQEDINCRKEKSKKKNTETKEPKLLTLSSNISDHDLGSKIKNIVKWLKKRHEVRIIVNCANNENAAEDICKSIETGTKHAGQMVQKRKKEDTIKFQLLALKNSHDKVSDEKVVQESESTNGEKHAEET